MKKKIKVSVRKLALGKNEAQNEQRVKSMVEVVDKPTSFQQLFQDLMKKKKKYGEEKCESMPTMVYNSKKNTPVASHRHPSSPLKHKKHSQPLIHVQPEEIIPSGITTPESYERNPSDRPQLLAIHKPWREYDQLIESLNHGDHSHLRENECFLYEGEIMSLLKQLQYDLDDKKLEPFLQDMLGRLEMATYGGIPSDNLKGFLMVIQGIVFDRVFMEKKHDDANILPNRIINKNLKLELNRQQGIALYHYFEPLRMSKLRNISRKISEHIISPEKPQTNTTKQSQSAQPENMFIQEGEVDEKQNRDKNRKFEYLQDEFVNLKNKLTEALSWGEKTKNSRPLLSVDVNLGDGLTEKLIVMEGETAKQVTQRLATKFSLTPDARQKFQRMLDSHLSKMLWKIEEVSEQLVSDRQQPTF